jgi:hypothetical protein
MVSYSIFIQNITNYRIQDISKILCQKSEVIFPTQKNEKKSYQCISTNNFGSTAKQRVDINPSDFCLWDA